MDVSKSEPEICQGKRIGLRRDLSRCRGFLLQRKLSRFSMGVGFFTLEEQIIDVNRNISRCGARPIQGCHSFLLTARQYGEVVLPDDSTGQSPGSLARNLSRCKEGMARVFAFMVQILLSITRVAVQA